MPIISRQIIDGNIVEFVKYMDYLAMVKRYEDEKAALKPAVSAPTSTNNSGQVFYK